MCLQACAQMRLTAQPSLPVSCVACACVRVCAFLRGKGGGREESLRVVETNYRDEKRGGMKERQTCARIYVRTCIEAEYAEVCSCVKGPLMK